MYYYILLRVIHNINILILSLHLSCKNRFHWWTVALDKRGYQVNIFCRNCFIKQEQHKDHHLASALASTMLCLLCVQLHFSNTKASRLLKHHDAPCPLLSTSTDVDLLLVLGWETFSLCLGDETSSAEQCLVYAFSLVSWTAPAVAT